MIRVIVAIDEKKGMADDNDIPWDLPSDKRYFREKTEHHAMLMGYGTYIKFKAPLPDRRNLVASTTESELRDGFELIADAREYLQKATEDVWVIGGPGLIETTLDLVDELYITQLKGDYNCTKFMPEYEHEFELNQATDYMEDNGITFRYEIWKRKQ